MISAVAEMYEIHPQTLRLYEREGLLRPSRSEGNTRLYTDEDLERLEFILSLAREMGVNMAGIAIVLQMRERMEEMNRQMQGFVDYVRTEMLTRMQQQQQPGAGLVPMRRPMVVPTAEPVTPSFGNGPTPKIKHGFRQRFTMLASHSTRMAVAASPAPRKTALIRNNRKMVALPAKIMRVYPLPILTTSSVPPITRSRSGA